MDNGTIDQKWERVESSFTITCEEELGFARREHKVWLSDETIKAIEKMRLIKIQLEQAKTRAQKEKLTGEYTESNKEDQIRKLKVRDINENDYEVIGKQPDVTGEKYDANDETVLGRIEKKLDFFIHTEKCEKRLPQAILVGSQKCGTSALFKFLDHHPRLAVCNRPPEVHYFDWNYKQSLEWYREKMPCSTPDQITMERTPAYFYSSDVAKRIKQMNDRIKLLILLKDPIEMCGSLYAMWKSFNSSDKLLGKSFEELLTIKKDTGEAKINTTSHMIKLATYVDHIEKWLAVFDRGQILFLDGTSFDHQPQKELQKIERFLRVEHFFTEKHFIYNSTKGKYCYTPNGKNMQCMNSKKGREHPPISDAILGKLKEYFKKYDAELEKMTGERFSWFE
ncbi:Heparan sulfate glucosamine 3-O-sulfotransferase 5 [Mactra antiquata]